MKEDIIPSLYRLLQSGPQSDEVLQFERRASHDAELLRTWQDFLVEQSIERQLPEAWNAYLNNINGIKERIAFQEEIQRSVRNLHARDVKAEITRVLPKSQITNISREPVLHRRLYLRVAAAAAIIICCVIGWKLFFVQKDNYVASIQDGPKIMVEEFELEGISEEMIVEEFAQRLPAKLAVASGLYPITSYAVDHATSRMRAKRVAQELGATHKLIGTLSGTGEELHLETSLVDIKTKDVLWKELFHTEQDPKALDDLEDQVTLRVVNVLNANVSPESHSHMMQEVSTNPLAVQLFLAGEREWAERSEASLRNSIRLLSDALAIDTASTIIRGYLALAYSTLVENGYGDSTSWPSAVMHANESLLRNPLNPESLVVLGTYAASIEKDYPKAAVFFDKALTIQPGDAKIHQAIAELHLRTGDIPVGKEHILIARAIEPEHRVVRWIETMYLTASGMLEMARQAADDLIKMYPDYPNIKIFDWQYHLSKKEYQRALNSIPAERSEEAKRYFQSFIYLEQKDYDAFHSFYSDRKPYDSLILLEHVQKDEWQQAYELLAQLFETDDLHLLAWFQIADFEMFNKMKQDSGIQRIFAYHGIKINVIPDVIEPEI